MKKLLSIIYRLLILIIIIAIPVILVFLYQKGSLIWLTQYVNLRYASVIAVVLMFLPFYYVASKIEERRRHILDYEFDVGLKYRLTKKHPSLTPKQIEQVFDGLRDFFYICHEENGAKISMPSKVVDDAWHEFILFTSEYKKFCQHAFGRFLHHRPAEAMKSPSNIQEGIRRVWRLACEKESIDPKKPHRLPLLFALDAELGIAGGFVYSLNCQPDDGHYCVNQISCGVERKGGCKATCGA